MTMQTTSTFVAAFELLVEEKNKRLLTSVKDRKETGRFLNAYDATEKLILGHTIKSAKGVSDKIEKTYTPQVDGTVFIRYGEFTPPLH